ncbi:MAG: MBOAT family protein [Spirochaetes bacterium]|nr:MBOAT family protein [Spirochaetota bacterium]
MFKYIPIFYKALFQAAWFIHIHYPAAIADFIVPLGISYYTLQCLCYIIEVHRGSILPEKHLGIFILYMMFFPKFAAGPIERPGFIAQFHERHDPDYEAITGGIKIFAWGLFKKTVIADRVAIVVNEVYGRPGHYHGIYFLLATFFFAVQLYSDFSGYTDMARGSARIFGFRLMENFKLPYGAGSIAEFWRRWHISLSTWFRDYLYIPLGGNRVPRVRHSVNIMTTFLASGLWHGANGTFVAWGALHGAFVVTGLWTDPLRERLAGIAGLKRLPQCRKALRVIATGTLVLFAWVLFRSGTLSEAINIYSSIFSGLADIITSVAAADTARLKSITDIARGNQILGFSRETYRPEMVITVFSILALWLFNTLHKHGDVWEILSRKSRFVRWSFYFFIAAGILFFGMFTKDQFIYFRF